MRRVLKLEERRTMPCTSYPLSRSSSVRYEPSWPVIPVMRARFAAMRVSADRAGPGTARVAARPAAARAAGQRVAIRVVGPASGFAAEIAPAEITAPEIRAERVGGLVAAVSGEPGEELLEVVALAARTGRLLFPEQQLLEAIRALAAGVLVHGHGHPPVQVVVWAATLSRPVGPGGGAPPAGAASAAAPPDAAPCATLAGHEHALRDARHQRGDPDLRQGRHPAARPAPPRGAEHRARSVRGPGDRRRVARRHGG